MPEKASTLREVRRSLYLSSYISTIAHKRLLLACHACVCRAQVPWLADVSDEIFETVFSNSLSHVRLARAD